ncbi:hypothetical protein LBW99_06175 [Wolbachia endosymbiont of Nasonia oneida]|uniref:hypothetical protein n=1 Tax=Wolbachia endosymbiont of Nasonia oneida TaxID=2175860 RepID=UPI00124FE3B3|nr:hypothetical protein [Wolbachia endosymbiont of Nasonia oneida]KAB2977699.1 hypothetical protein DEF52_05740 [Wolbachia endosymbiont of Nasonia oneida]
MVFQSGNTRVKREPISIFKQIAQEEDKQKKRNFEDLLNQLRTFYPNDLKIGVALKTGDCFFDSLAQGLNELNIKSGHRFTAKSLRKGCADYAKANKGSDSWVYKEVIRGAEGYFVPQKDPDGEVISGNGCNKQDNTKSFFKYLEAIENMATESGSPPIWGRLDIEGRMICAKYKVKIEVIELLEEPLKGSTENQHVIQSEQGEGDSVVRIVNYKMHFVPLLNKLEKDIKEAIEVSREEVYGIEDIENHNLVTAAGVYDKLRQVEFNDDDSGNPHTWAGIDQINSYVNWAIDNDGDELACYIGPNNFGFNDEESIKSIAKHICRRIGKDSDIVNDYKSDRPAIVISNTVTVIAESSTDASKQGGSHWIGWVLLPKKYVTLSGKEINNDKYQVLFFDSLSHSSFPEGLKKFLTEGGEITEKTDTGKKQIKLMPFCKEDEIDFKSLKDLTGQQMNGSDCGWWAVYYVLMTVYTGGVEFLEPLKGKKLSAKPLRGMMGLQESAEQLPDQPKFPDQPRNKPLNDLKKDIEGYLGESFHFANIFADSKGIYLGYSNNQNGTKEERLKFAVLTNEKDSQDQQIVRCYTISRTENISGSRFSEGERVLMKNALPSGQSFAFKEHKMFIRKDGGLVCKPFSKKQEFPKNVKGPCNRFEALNVPFSPPHTSTPITRRNIPRGHDKAYAYKFLENLLRIEMSPDVLVDIIVDSKDDTKIAVVGRPKVLGSSRKQMRHVISYSSIKSAIESAVKVEEKVDYILHVKNMVEQVMTPLIISREGLCLTEGQYNNLKEKEVIPSGKYDEFKLTTETKKGKRKKYHLIYDKEIVETVNNGKFFTEEEIKKARIDFNTRLRKYISHGIDYLTDGLAAEDINTVTIMCEGVARIILTMFNQDIHAAFPDEGNTLSEEIRLYESQNDAKEPKAKVFSILLHDEISQEIVGDYNLRIRIVNNEGYIVKRTAYALSVLDSLLETTNINSKESKKYLDDYNEKCNSTIRTHSQDLGNYNGKINKNNLNDVLYNHVAKHLYEVFDFKPLEKRVLAPRREAEDAIKVYPSARGKRGVEYSVQEGDKYRKLKVREAKDYNDKAIFRSGMADKLIGEILSSKIVSHVIIHLVPYGQLREGFIENAVEEGLGNGMQEILNSFINLVRLDYIDAPFHEEIGEVLNNDWVKEILERYQEQNQSFSEASSIIVDESDTKKPPKEGGINESHIEKLPKEGVVSDIEQRLKGKGVKEHIYKGGYMKKRKSNIQMAFEGAHSNSLSRAMSNNEPYSITEWVEDNLMKGDDQIRGGKTSRTAFYEAEKSLIRLYILKGEFDNIVTLLDAIHNEKFKNGDRYKELKIKECEVLTGAIKMAEGPLKRDDAMHKNLHDLLEGKQEKLKEMEDIDLEKDGVSTKITEALNIVQVNSAGSSKGK